MRLCRCGAIVQGRCSRCDGSGDKGSTKAGYDRQWRNLRERYFANNPLCEVCELHGRVTAARELHHIIPIAQDASRRLDVENLIAVCLPCHDAIEGKPDPRKATAQGVVKLWQDVRA